MKTNKLFMHLAAGALAVGLAGSAVAAEIAKPAGFPTRPLTMIVPSAGGGSDQLARAMANSMDKVAGIKFQVVNKPGGTAAIPDFMLAPADGYTVMEHIDNVALSKGDINENPATDWVPICTTQITFSQIYVRPDDRALAMMMLSLCQGKSGQADNGQFGQGRFNGIGRHAPVARRTWH